MWLAWAAFLHTRVNEQAEPASDPKSRPAFAKVWTGNRYFGCMQVDKTESRIEDVLTTLMPKEVLKEQLGVDQKLMMNIMMNLMNSFDFFWVIWLWRSIMIEYLGGVPIPGRIRCTSTRTPRWRRAICAASPSCPRAGRPSKWWASWVNCLEGSMCWRRSSTSTRLRPWLGL